jgi:hypothetical protein
VAEDDVSGGPAVGGVAPVVGPRWPWAVFFGLIGAPLIAYGWAIEAPAKPLATVMMDQARGMGI